MMAITGVGIVRYGIVLDFLQMWVFTRLYSLKPMVNSEWGQAGHWARSW
jgi:hypothetical protein